MSEGCESAGPPLLKGSNPAQADQPVEGAHDRNGIDREREYVEPATIEMGIALAALSAFFAAQQTYLLVRLLAVLAFATSIGGAYYLFYAYVERRLPELFSYISRGGWLDFLWAVPEWARIHARLVRNGGRLSVSDTKAAGLLNLFFGFNAAVLTLWLWVLASFLRR